MAAFYFGFVTRFCKFQFGFVTSFCKIYFGFVTRNCDFYFGFITIYRKSLVLSQEIYIFALIKSETCASPMDRHALFHRCEPKFAPT